MWIVKLKPDGRGVSSRSWVERRERVARNCSGRFDAGGGLKRFSLEGSPVAVWELSEVAKEVRVSEEGICGNEEVEKRYRSSGSEAAEWMTREVEATVH